MKKIFFVFAISSALISCKKETKSSPVTEVKDSNPIQNKPTSGYGTNIIDKDGNTYKTVFIGKQQWMAENLKVSRYNDGTIIPKVSESINWANNTTGAWCYYNNDETNNETYGKLYNWYTISLNTNGNKNICPFGWHIPSDSEWTVLSDYLGGETVAGGKMKAIGNTIWESPNTNASNSSMFTGLPGGTIGSSGNFNNFGSDGYWWSSTESSINNAWNRNLENNNEDTDRENNGKRNGFSLRCIKD